jgi:molybdopterin/thiamine biosynthesis adenylyltransferase
MPQSLSTVPELHIRDHTRDRYHALAISPVWKLDRLREAKALIVGAGALGNEVAKNLAMMGVRLLAVADRDTVEMANLTRSIFFRERDHGRNKTDVIAERLADVNPDVEVLALQGELDETIGLGLVRRMDMVFSCLDSRLARRSVNRLCEKVAKPWVDGAMEDLLGEVGVYVPGQGPCYECKLTPVDREIIAEATSCRGIARQNLIAGKVPTTSTMGSIVGAIQVQEALKLYHGVTNNRMIGKRLQINCELNDFYATGVERKPGCEGHFRFGDITEAPSFSVSKTSARNLLDQFLSDTGVSGYVELGRELITALRCGNCNSHESLTALTPRMSESAAACPQCGALRDPLTTHIVQGEEEYALWPLERLGIPKLDILEVRGPGHTRWYELTGDLETMPACLAMPAMMAM